MRTVRCSVGGVGPGGCLPRGWGVCPGSGVSARGVSAWGVSAQGEGCLPDTPPMNITLPQLQQVLQITH